MRLLLPILLLVASLTSCAAQNQRVTTTKATATKAKPTAKATSAAKAPIATQAAIVFRRTPCFGTCPHYEASFYPDSRMQYEGFAYAPAAGKREVKLPAAVVTRIMQDAEKIGFFQMPEEYPTNFSDMPSTILTIRGADGNLKTVQAEENFPPALQKLFDSIDQEVVKAFEVTK